MSDPQAQFEARLHAAMHPGRMDAQFAAQLRGQLAAAARQPRSPRRPRTASRPHLTRRAWAAAFVLLALLASLLAIGPQRVLARVLGWLGYVPGVGFVESEGGLRVLDQPQSQTREGIRIDVLAGLIDDQHTFLTIYSEGIRQDQKPTSEDVAGCWQNPTLRLPDGTALQVVAGEGGGGLSWFQQRFTYPALPPDVNDVVLEIPCVPEALPGLAPENWEFPLHFVPAPAGFEVLPVQTLPQPEPVDLHGFSLSVDDFTELADGYLLRGRLAWQADVHDQPDFNFLEFALFDANGQPIPSESSYEAPVEGEHHISWTLQTGTKQIAGPARVVLQDLALRLLQEFGPTNSFEVDLGSQPQDGQVWQLNQALQLGNSTAAVTQVQFEARADGTYALLSNITFDPEQIDTLSLMDLDNLSRSLWWSGAGNIAEGQIEIGIGYDYLPTGIHRFWVDNYFERLRGPWQASVTLPPPPVAAGTPGAAPACLTQDLWSQVSAAPLPFSETDRLLVEGAFADGVYFPTLFVASPSGSQPTDLVPGGWGALSADGSQVAYTDAAGLHLLSSATQQDRLLSSDGSAYSPAWSLDGSQLAFIKGGDGIWLIAADGSNERRLPGTHADMIGLAGWLPDGRYLVVATNVAAGTQVQQVDVNTGEIKDLFLINSHKGGFVVLSPDGQYIAYSGELFGSFNYGLYVSRLDGSQQRLVAEPGDRALFMAGAWSPDGQWLLINPLDTSALEPSLQHPITISPSTCAVVVLSAISGNVIGWAAPQ